MPVAGLAAPPKGFVLFGLFDGIRFSKLTSDEFSPKKLSGVLRTPTGALLLALVVEFHGFVEAESFLAVSPLPPKKSSNTSPLLPLLALVVGFVALVVVVVARFDVNKSKSSSLFVGSAPVDHGSLVVAVVVFEFALDVQGLV